MYRLIVERGMLRGKRWVIEQPTVTIGRAETCDLQFPDRDLEPLEARLEERAEGVYLFQPRPPEEEAGAVEERRHTLAHGDRLIIGPVRLRFDAPQRARTSLQQPRTRCGFHRLTLVGVALLLLLQLLLLSAVLAWRQGADLPQGPAETIAPATNIPVVPEET